MPDVTPSPEALAIARETFRRSGDVATLMRLVAIEIDRARDSDAIVSWLRTRYDAQSRGSAAWEDSVGALVRDIADAIARGEHRG